MGHLYALDFDGVLCDSCGESSISALKAAKIRWPSLFSSVDSALEEWILDSMRIVRPVVETGYENVLLVRLLLHLRNPEPCISSILNELTVGRILEEWLKIKPVIMEKWGETSKEALVNLFGSVRDEWISCDLPGWINANRFYPGIADSLSFATSELYIVTTKQARFAAILLQKLAGIDFPLERIYGLGSGPKVEVLKQLQADERHRGLSLHFVEDRLATLINVTKEPELDGWNLFLGTWGYNTESERSAASSVQRINILELSEFCAKLK